MTLVSYAKAKLDNTWATVTGPALRKIEPVRAKELELAQKPVKTLLLARDGAGPDKVAGKIAAAIDAWLVALEVFEKEALKPESRALLERLRDLREKAAAAKDAVSDEAS